MVVYESIELCFCGGGGSGGTRDRRSQPENAQIIQISKLEITE